MLKTKHTIQTLIFTLLLSACGEGGSSDAEDKAVTPTASASPSVTLSPEVENNLNNQTEVTVTATPPPTSTPIPTTGQTEEEKIPELPTTGSTPQRETEVIKEETNIKTNLPTANAGTDTSTTLNETITLTGTATNVGTQNIFYEWKKNITILSTTASVDYTPKEEDSLPTAGERVDTLTFTISNKNGFLDSDQINIVVHP